MQHDAPRFAFASHLAALRAACGGDGADRWAKRLVSPVRLTSGTRASMASTTWFCPGNTMGARKRPPKRVFHHRSATCGRRAGGARAT